jgi:SP family sugar:H+ symporter-like MFS transporter
MFPAPYLVNVGKGSAGLQAKVFFIWGSTCLCCIIFTYFCIPEVGSVHVLLVAEKSSFFLQTKGLSLEQIDVMYQNTVPHKSLAYRRELMEGNIRVSDADSSAPKASTSQKGDNSSNEKV